MFPAGHFLHDFMIVCFGVKQLVKKTCGTSLHFPCFTLATCVPMCAFSCALSIERVSRALRRLLLFLFARFPALYAWACLPRFSLASCLPASFEGYMLSNRALCSRVRVSRASRRVPVRGFCRLHVFSALFEAGYAFPALHAGYLFFRALLPLYSIYFFRHFRTLIG